MITYTVEELDRMFWYYSYATSDVEVALSEISDAFYESIRNIEELQGELADLYELNGRLMDEIEDFQIEIITLESEIDSLEGEVL